MLLPTQRNTRSRLGLLTLALVAIALTALGSPSGASAQGQPLTVNVVGFSADDWPAPQAILTVEDDRGHPLPDLASSAFQAYLDDAPAPVTAVTRAVDGSLPIAVVLALDVSGSMEGAALDQAKAAAGRFLEGLGPLDTVAVLTFSDTVTLVQPFTLDRTAALDAISGLSAGGKTALYPAAAESARLAASAGAARRAVVLLSDGGLGVLVTDPGDGGAAQTREDALAAAETLGVPVFAIGLGTQIDRDFLGSLAETTGGQFAETPSPEGLTLLYQQVAERLRGQYVVTLNASGFGASRADAATLRIEVAADELAGSGERLICPQSACVSVPALSDGERLETARTVAAQVVAEDPVVSVSFLVDGQALSTVTAPPYEFLLDPVALGDGEHAFAVEVTTVSGSTELRELSVTLGAATGGSSISLVMVAAVAIGLTVVAALILWFALRRRGGGEQGEEPLVVLPRSPLGPRPEVPLLERLEEERIRRPAPTIEEARGFLRAVGGPIQGETFALGGNPVSVGSGPRCRIHLEESVDGVDIPAEYARVWIRDGKLMVHELRRLTAIGSVGGRWEILTSGDMFSLGPYTFRFELSGDEAGPSGANGVSGEVPVSAPIVASASTTGTAPTPIRSDVPATGPFAPRVPAESDEPADVPNVLRSRPAGEPADLPNVLRDSPPSDEAAAAADVPNVLRDASVPREEPSQSPGEPEPPVPNVLRDRPQRPDGELPGTGTDA